MKPRLPWLKSPESRSPSSKFEADLVRANDKRLKLLEDRRLSVHTSQGRLAILVSFMPDYFSVVKGSRSEQEQADDLMEYARRLRDQRNNDKTYGSEPKIVDATKKNVKAVFLDQTVSDVIFIGNFGSLGTFRTTDRSSVSWMDLISWTDHLKSGTVEIRHNTTVDPNVPEAPLAALNTAYDTKFIAAPNVEVPIYDPGDRIQFRPIFAGMEGSLIDKIRALNELPEFAANQDMQQIPRLAPGIGRTAVGS